MCCHCMFHAGTAFSLLLRHPQLAASDVTGSDVTGSHLRMRKDWVVLAVTF